MNPRTLLACGKKIVTPFVHEFSFSCFVFSGWFDGQLFSLSTVCMSTVEDGLQARVRCRPVRLAVGFMLLLDWQCARGTLKSRLCKV
jgi:hypothetical protein